MDNNALVAALGPNATAAVHGYRLQIISEAERRGLRLADQAAIIVARADGAGAADPIDICLTFGQTPTGGRLAGRILRWNPSHGWSLSPTVEHQPVSYYAGPAATPLQIVPKAAEVLDWATGKCNGSSTAPGGVELDADLEAIHRLLEFTDSHQQTPLPEAEGTFS
jgi:hypothetical protein